MTNFRWGSATDIGQVRQNNQDAVLSDDGLFLVADGMGGHRGGEVASAIAVEQVQAHFTEPTTEALVEAVQAANKAVVDRSDTEPELRGMGTTLTGLARVRSDEDEDRLAIVNVGDSRLYLLKGGTQLQQITEDHSLVATLERQGQLTKAEAAVHPHRNILTRALGIDPMVLVDSWEILPFVGDRYLLCSDGLFNEVPEEEITRILREVDDPDAAASTLVEMANAGGGRDNITVLIVDVLTDGGNAAAADAALDRVAKATHASLDPAETAFTIANEGRRLIQCDRVSVAIKRGGKCKIESVSGQDVFDARSNTIVLLNRLSSAVARTGVRSSPGMSMPVICPSSSRVSSV